MIPRSNHPRRSTTRPRPTTSSARARWTAPSRVPQSPASTPRKAWSGGTQCLVSWRVRCVRDARKMSGPARTGSRTRLLTSPREWGFRRSISKGALAYKKSGNSYLLRISRPHSRNTFPNDTNELYSSFYGLLRAFLWWKWVSLSLYISWILMTQFIKFIRIYNSCFEGKLFAYFESSWRWNKLSTVRLKLLSRINALKG